MARTKMKPLYGVIAVGGGFCTLIYDCRGIRGGSPVAARRQGYDESVFCECDPLAEFPVVDLTSFEGTLPPLMHVAEESSRCLCGGMHQPLTEYLAILRSAGVPIRRCLNGVLRPEPRDPEPEASERVQRRHVVEALRWAARKKCNRRNCGTVCLCGPCHAREALRMVDPNWRR